MYTKEGYMRVLKRMNKHTEINVSLSFSKEESEWDFIYNLSLGYSYFANLRTNEPRAAPQDSDYIPHPISSEDAYANPLFLNSNSAALLSLSLINNYTEWMDGWTRVPADWASLLLLTDSTSVQRVLPALHHPETDDKLGLFRLLKVQICVCLKRTYKCYFCNINSPIQHHVVRRILRQEDSQLSSV